MGLRIQVFPAAGFQCHLWLCGLGSKIVAVSPGFPDNGVPRWNWGHRSTIAVQDTPRKNSQGVSETYGPVFWIMRQRVEKYGTSPGRHERGSNRSEGSNLRPWIWGAPEADFTVRQVWGPPKPELRGAEGVRAGRLPPHASGGL